VNLRSAGARHVIALLLAAVAACSGNDDVTDAGPPGDDANSACDEDCLVGWWVRVNGECSSFCNPPGEPAECGEADCELLAARGFAADGSFDSLFPITHSPSASSLTLLLPGEARTWAADEDCDLLINDMPNPWPACTDATLVFNGENLTAVPAPMSDALSRAAASGPGPQSY
jgi:hypothetical protein